MTWFNDPDVSKAKETYDNTPTEHKAKLTHELLGGAAAFEAAKAWQDHKAKHGQPSSHAKAKEFIAGAVGAFVEREFETKGLDFIDKQRAKKHAEEVCDQHVSKHY